MYGLSKGMNLKNMVLDVCLCLGNGSNNTAHLLILETMSAETGQGSIQDKTKYAGMGICQFDRLPFYDVKSRTSIANKNKIYEHFGIDISLVEWEHLRYNPLLSIIFCRLKYILIPSAIPGTIIGRAMYWKRWYNSMKGKGTPEHYIAMNEKGLTYA